MLLEIPLSEIQTFVANHYQIKVGLRNVEKEKIEVNYIVSFTLSIKRLTAHEIVLHYQTNGLVDLLAKGAHYIFTNKLDTIPLLWDSKNHELTIKLMEIKPMVELFKYLHITKLSIANHAIHVTLKTIPKSHKQPSSETF